MSKRGHIIKAVDTGSIADQLELEPGDAVLSIDGHELEDIFDYDYNIKREPILLAVKKIMGKNGSWK